MAEPAAAPLTRRRLDAGDLPLWMCLAGMTTGVLLLTATAEGAVAHDGEMAGHGDAHHIQHLLMIAATTLIMMSPLAFPLLRTLARTTLWTEAAIALAAAWAGFVGLWCLAAAAMHVAGELLSRVITAPGAIVALTACCVAAQYSRRRAAMLNACRRTRPMRPRRPVVGGLGWSADAAYRCIKMCAAPMTLMALSPTVAVSAAITALLWWERFSSRRRELRGALVFAYVVVGAGMLLATATDR